MHATLARAVEPVAKRFDLRPIYYRVIGRMYSASFCNEAVCVTLAHEIGDPPQINLKAVDQLEGWGSWKVAYSALSSLTVAQRVVGDQIALTPLPAMEIVEGEAGRSVLEGAQEEICDKAPAVFGCDFWRNCNSGRRQLISSPFLNNVLESITSTVMERAGLLGLRFRDFYCSKEAIHVWFGAEKALMSVNYDFICKGIDLCFLLRPTHKSLNNVYFANDFGLSVPLSGREPEVGMKRLAISNGPCEANDVALEIRRQIQIVESTWPDALLGEGLPNDPEGLAEYIKRQ